MKRRELLAFLVAIGAAGPLPMRAQPNAKSYRLAVFNPATSLAEMSAHGNSRYKAFFDELGRLGYMEGSNLFVDRQSGEGDSKRLAGLASHIVALRPDVIFAVSNRAVNPLKTATSAIPIVVIGG